MYINNANPPRGSLAAMRSVHAASGTVSSGSARTRTGWGMGKRRALGDISSDVTGIVSSLEGDATGAVQNVVGTSIANTVLGPYKYWIYGGVIMVGFILARDLFARPRSG
jgi:hypothetical protein